MTNVLRGLFRGLWDEVLIELLKGGFTEGKELFAKRVRSYITTDPRAALVLILLSLKPEERANLTEARRKAKMEGWENRFVQELGKVLPFNADKSLNEQKAREILKRLNEVSPDELDEFMEFLTHDPIAEWFCHWVLGKGGEAVVGMTEALTELVASGINLSEENWPKVRGQLKETNESLNDTILGWRSRDPWWIRVSRSRRRQSQQQVQLDSREERLRQQREQQIRERVAEIFDQFRRDWSEQKGGQQ